MAEVKKHAGGRRALAREEKLHSRTFRVTDAEWETINKQAAEANVTTAEYIREAVRHSMALSLAVTILQRDMKPVTIGGDKA